LLQLIERRVNSPLTSSCGRLFDAVAAIAGVRQKVNYEAQAAIELEMAISDSAGDEAYPFELMSEDNILIMGTCPLFEAIVRDLDEHVPAGAICARFHNGLVAIFTKIAQMLRGRTRLNRVCLSGGTFNNVYLAEGLCRRLRKDGFEVFTHHEIPCGDGGLSLGQALAAAHKVRSAKSPHEWTCSKPTLCDNAFLGLCSSY
jgi:hydrogenase maturation protein HypF